MRDYLFRGKPKDKDQFNAFSVAWAEYCFNGFIYGSLVKCNNRCYIAVTAQCSNKSIINNGITTMIEVIPETVGPYIGLTDSNGKKIFEGDIVKSCEYDDVYFVKYFDSDNYSAFDCVPDVPLCECNGLSYLVNEEGCKVIGNIYDDKEILDVK